MGHLTTRIVWGGFLVVIGVGFLLGSILPQDVWQTIVRWWPSAIIVLGLWISLKYPRSLLVGLLVLAVGVVLLLGKLGVAGLGMGSLWPLFLIFVGVYLVFGQRGAVANSPTDSDIAEVVVFGGMNRRITSTDFKSANVTTVFGGSVLDLRDAKITDGAVIEVVAIFGGVELKLPENVQVINEAVAILGGVEDSFSKHKAPGTSADKPKLHVKGIVLFAGVEIK